MTPRPGIPRFLVARVALGLAAFLPHASVFAAEGPSPAASRVLRVDPRDPAALPTLKAAAAQIRPGDTLWLAPGSGPYREELFITVSGTEDAPITVEGNGNEITGFEPLRFRPDGDGGHVALVSVAHPFVLRHQGRRIREDVAAGGFTDGVRYDAGSKRLHLAPGLSPEGWEISARVFAVRLLNVSHHRYRDLVASGARNDGFNLHGRGSGLRFENITGRDNLDEGFSAHGEMESEILVGRFFGNDNGIFNIERSRALLRDVDIHDNLGIGLCASGEAHIETDGVRVWGNGMAQLLLMKEGRVSGSRLQVYRNPHSTRPWISHMESAKWQAPSTVNQAAAQIPHLVRLEDTAPRP